MNGIDFLLNRILIQIQLNKNGMQIHVEGIENMIITMVFFPKLQKKKTLKKHFFIHLYLKTD